MDVSDESQLYGVPAGVAVQSVAEDSPAQQAGVEAGDVITAINGVSMDRDALVRYVGSANVGDSLTLSVYRKGQTLELTVTVGEQIQSAQAKAETTQQSTAPKSSAPQSTMPYGRYPRQ